MSRRVIDGDVFAPTDDPAWVLVERGYAPPDAISRAARFAIGNGFLGIRAGPAILHGEALESSPGVYVAGLFDKGPDGVGPVLTPGPGLQIRLTANGEPLALDEAAFFQMTLDLSRGMLLTDERHRMGPSAHLRLRTLRLASLREPAVGLQLVDMEADGGEVVMDLEAAWGAAPSLVEDHEAANLKIWRTRRSGMRLAAASTSVLSVAEQVVSSAVEAPFHGRWRWMARPGQSARFTYAVAMTRGEDDGREAGRSARAKLENVVIKGWTSAIAGHQEAWMRRWRDSDVEVEGDDDAQRDLRFALFHLNGAANPADERVSIAARGLTGDQYGGHVFWDTEIYLLPFYTLTNPPAARALLMYRFHTLDAARAKARRLGWRGALYAWESARSGAEVTPEHVIGLGGQPVEVFTGTQEQHISADVAYAVWHYWLASGDDGFLRDAGAEILLETGRFWASRAQLEADGRRHIRGVMGPDEYHRGIDDSAYTNVMARWTIERALETAALLSQRWPERWDDLSRKLDLDEAELQTWREAAKTIVSGFDPDLGLFEQFAGYFDLEDIDLAHYPERTTPMDLVLGQERISRTQIIKQADVVALLAVLPEAFPDGSAAKNLRYYETRCGHGSSLSRVTHGLAAARLGDPAAALTFFRDAAAVDLHDSQGAISGGVHIACLGGLWMMAVYGFGGLSFSDEGLALDPHLPTDWAGLTFRVQWRDRFLKIRIDQAGVEAILESGDAMRLAVRGRAHDLRPGVPLWVGPEISVRMDEPRPSHAALDLAPT